MAEGFNQVVSWYVCTGLAWILVIARLFTRWRKLGSLSLDDAFIILSACCLAGGLAIQQHMWNMGMAEIPKASRDNYIEMMKMILPGSILYVSSVWAIKIALVIFYKHIAAPGTKLQINLQCYYWSAGYYIPRHFLPHHLSVLPAKQAMVSRFVVSMQTRKRRNKLLDHVNIGTDVITLSLPISMVLQLQMKTREKIGVCAIFALGLLVVIASIIRAYFSKRNETMLTCTVSMVETTVAIIASCLPPLRSAIMGQFSTAASRPNCNNYGGRIELSSVRNSNPGGRTRSSRITNIVGGTRARPNDSEDELFKEVEAYNTPSVNASESSNKNGITVSTASQVKNSLDKECLVD
uniref:Rhodopsin domain-containing protein n=1 Tax=Bionectria ochroleuca TaxID=29856 RepID=A0A8H7NC50_BIOOC